MKKTIFSHHSFLKKHYFLFILLSLGFFLPSIEAIDIQGLTLLDWQRQLLDRSSKNTKKIILIEVDQYSLDRMQEDQGIGWPWPREMYGGIAGFTAEGKAKAVMIDILFNNETAYGISSDNEFSRWLEKAGNVYLAAALTKKQSNQNRQSLNISYLGESPERSKMRGIITPVTQLLDASAGLGAVNNLPDKDGTFRRVTPAFTIDNKILPILALSSFVNEESKDIYWDAHSLVMGNRLLPLDEDHRLWVDFPPRETYLRYSAYDVIQSMIALQSGKKPAIDPLVFTNAYVMVGYVAPGLYDLKPTPFSARAPAMEIHAAVLDNWLSNNFLKPMSQLHSSLIGLFFALIAYAVFMLRKNVLHAIYFSFFLLLGNFVLSIILLTLSLVPIITYQFLPALLVTIGIGSQRFIFESREKEFRQKSLERMVSPDVTQWLLEDPAGRMKRNGELRRITVLFSDIEGFTTISEKLGAAKTVELINQYMDLMQNVILQQNGTINKFIGDAVMAVWGAPKEQENQTVLAVKAALKANHELASFIFEYEPGKSMPLNMRIGIDHGDCIVGNIGSSERFEYAVIGDTVNQSARLEGLNKYYQNRFMVSESVWLACGDTFFGRCIDHVIVKGKSESVKVYEPMAILGEETTAQQKIKVYYERAWKLYESAQWNESTAVLRELLQEFEDGPSQSLLDRIADVDINSEQFLTGKWDGVWHFDSK